MTAQSYRRQRAERQAPTLKLRYAGALFSPRGPIAAIDGTQLRHSFLMIDEIHLAEGKRKTEIESLVYDLASNAASSDHCAKWLMASEEVCSVPGMSLASEFLVDLKYGDRTDNILTRAHYAADSNHPGSQAHRVVTKVLVRSGADTGRFTPRRSIHRQLRWLPRRALASKRDGKAPGQPLIRSKSHGFSNLER